MDETGFWEFVQTSNQARTTTELSSSYLRFIEGFGLQRFMVGDLSPSTTEERESHLGLIGNYPRPWVDHYLERHYIEVDPVYQWCRRSNVPFTWERVLSEPLSPASRRVMSEARDFGLCSGFGVSVPQRSGRLMGIGLSGSERTFRSDKDSLSVLAAGAYQLFNVLADLTEEPQDPPSLTPREREVLLWIASGRSKVDTAQLLNLSEACVKRHFENIFRKLGTSTLAGAVAKGIHWGLISPP